MMNKRILFYSFIGIFLLLCDRITKYMALLYLSDAPYYYSSIVSFELVINKGISWGIFHSSSTVMFTVIFSAIVCVTAILCWHAYVLFKQRLPIVGQVLVIIGSMCNLMDRIYYGGVIDFIVFSYNTYAWPVFNVADMAIVGGIFIMLLQPDADAK